MKKLFPLCVIAFLPLVILVVTGGYSSTAYAQDAFTSTPTYDPLAEPFVSENPSEYELGRNWYWHNCMTCHGDMGQGLTDEFRRIWPEDHQNCWAHGCHGGRVDDEGFPIPTIVPALVSEGKLSQFSSLQTFEEFLESTHPPQDPGCLDDEQYQAIAKYVFSMNDRLQEEITPTSTSIPTSTSMPISDEIPAEGYIVQSNIFVYIGLGILTIVVGLWACRKFPFIKPEN